jgi:hypothetical protein
MNDWKESVVVFEGTPVAFYPLEPKGKHPELVVCDLNDLIEASKKYRKTVSSTAQQCVEILLLAKEDIKNLEYTDVMKTYAVKSKDVVKIVDEAITAIKKQFIK